MHKLYRLFILCVITALGLFPLLSQTAASISPSPILQFVNESGYPLAGGKLYTCVAGSTCGPMGSTPQITWAAVDTAGNGISQHSNPIILDSLGSASVFLSSGLSYKYVATDQNGVVKFTQDNIRSGPNPAAFQQFVSVLQYGAIPGGGDSSGAFQNAINFLHNTRGGGALLVPCGVYTLGNTITINDPKISLWGENESCVTLNYVGGAAAIVWQMVPFTTNPAGEFSGFTLTCTSAATYGIDSGSIVGSWWHDIDVSGCTKPSAAAIHLHAIGAFETWVERNHFGPNVSTGGTGTQRNTHGFLLDADNAGDSFGYNNFEDIKVNASTGQEGFTLASGFMYNLPQMNMVCNIENNLTGTVGPICIRSSSNWDSVTLQLRGEFQNSGTGTGTPYRVQVDAGARFSNFGGSHLNVFAPGGAQVADNIIPAPASSPNVTLVQGTSITSWDTGSFTLNGVATTPQPIQRANYGSLGLLIGNNIESPYLSMFQGTGDEVVFGTVATDTTIGTMTKVARVDAMGQFAAGNFTTICTALVANCNAPPPIVDGTAIWNVGATTSPDRSGFTNSFYATATGINESTSGDVNFSGGMGFVEGANIAHPMVWGYELDPISFEVYKKTFQTPITSLQRVAYVTTSGEYHQSGNVVAMGNNTTWTTGAAAPSGACTTGSLYTNTLGTPNTLYVCQTAAWVGK